VSPRERFWTRRLRWRLRGALQWPVFVVVTLLEGFVLAELPPVAFRDMDFALGVIIATFANLFLVGVVAPFLTRRLIARRAVAVSEVEREVLRDRAGALLLAAGLGATLVSGLANRPVIVSETEATEENARAVREFVNRSDSAELRRNLETANTVRLSEGFFRTCIARDDRRRYVCVFVDTTREPTSIRRDPSAEPNSALTRPGDR
jgi:hypothetical protein